MSSRILRVAWCFTCASMPMRGPSSEEPFLAVRLRACAGTPFHAKPEAHRALAPRPRRQRRGSRGRVCRRPCRRSGGSRRLGPVGQVPRTPFATRARGVGYLSIRLPSTSINTASTMFSAPRSGMAMDRVQQARCRPSWAAGRQRVSRQGCVVRAFSARFVRTVGERRRRVCGSACPAAWARRGGPTR